MKFWEICFRPCPRPTSSPRCASAAETQSANAPRPHERRAPICDGVGLEEDEALSVRRRDASAAAEFGSHEGPIGSHETRRDPRPAVRAVPVDDVRGFQGRPTQMIRTALFTSTRGASSILAVFH